jgi:putative hydrolase of the HAD superfamily
MFDLIAFDADDTLWHNESLYQKVRERFSLLLKKYEIHEHINPVVDQTEIDNLHLYGYGVMSFILSLIEAGITLTQGSFRSEDVSELIKLGKEMLSAEVEVFEYTRAVLEECSQTHHLMLLTKGDLNHQHLKVNRSGLAEYFKFIEIVSDKKPETYQRILSNAGVDASRFLMVGNSIRSDIFPVLKIGGWAVYIPHDLTWVHEQMDAPHPELPRFFEIKHLGELPDLINRLERPQAATDIT